MSKEGQNSKRKQRPNDGRFQHDLQESRETKQLEFKQRISRRESDIMSVAKKDVVTISPTTTIMGASRTMVEYGYRRLPVADPGTKRIEGICTVGDIIDFLGGGEKRKIIENRYDGNMIVAINGPITEIMQRNVITVSSESSLEDAVALMIEKSVGGVPVIDADNRVVGIVTETDIVHIMGDSISGKQVKDIMSKRVVTAPPEFTIESAAKTMISSGFRRLPVVTDSFVCGIITATDIMRYLGSGDAFKKLVTGNISEAVSMPISGIMTGDIITVSPEQDLAQTAAMMSRHRIGSFPVIKDGRLVGIVTERDILESVEGAK